MEPVKGLPGYHITKNAEIYSEKRGGIRKLSTFPDKKGYMHVTLMRENGTWSPYLIHRLMGIAFIPNPDNKATINHKNGVTGDNRLCNLEWMTHQENHLHAIRVLGRKPSPCHWKGIASPRARPVYCYSMSGKYLSRYPSGKQAAIETGGSAAAINQAVAGRTKSSNGYLWSHKKAVMAPYKKDIIMGSDTYNSVSVSAYNKEGEKMFTFTSMVEAASHFGVTRSNIYQAARGYSKSACGYTWRVI